MFNSNPAAPVLYFTLLLTHTFNWIFIYNILLLTHWTDIKRRMLSPWTVWHFLGIIHINSCGFFNAYLCLSVSKLREHMALSLEVFCPLVFISFISYFHFGTRCFSIFFLFAWSAFAALSLRLKNRKNTYITITFSVVFISSLFWCKILKVFTEQILCLLKTVETKWHLACGA